MDYNWPPQTDLELACYFGEIAMVLMNNPDSAEHWATVAGHHASIAIETGEVSMMVS